MKRAQLLICLVSALCAPAGVAAQEFYPTFALVVQLPTYETFLKNIGNSPIRVDHYDIRSDSASLSPSGWASLDAAGPQIVAALGPGADQFDAIGAVSSSLLAEFNLLGSATWQPGQSWSIGFPFDTGDPDFVLDPVFRFASPDGLVLNGGTVVPEMVLAQAAFLIVPEPPAIALLGLAFVGMVALGAGAGRAIANPPWRRSASPLRPRPRRTRDQCSHLARLD